MVHLKIFFFKLCILHPFEAGLVTSVLSGSFSALWSNWTLAVFNLYLSSYFLGSAAEVNVKSVSLENETLVQNYQST